MPVPDTKPATVLAPLAWGLICPLLLTACVAGDRETVTGDAGSEAAAPAQTLMLDPLPVPQERRRSVPSREVVRAMVIADILYEAQEALEDNRLMSPASGNAYDLYFQVLSIDPQNEVAIDGFEEIGRRYIALANSATRLGQYDQAAVYLARSELINNETPALEQARRNLREARESNTEFFSLDADALSRRDLDIMVELGGIGEYLRTQEARFLIIARSDEEGRWIYRTMREAVGGYRLRGNITLGSEPGIRVTLPEAEAE